MIHFNLLMIISITCCTSQLAHGLVKELLFQQLLQSIRNQGYQYGPLNPIQFPEQQRINHAPIPDQQRINYAPIPDQQRIIYAPMPDQQRINYAPIPDQQRINYATISDQQRINNGPTLSSQQINYTERFVFPSDVNQRNTFETRNSVLNVRASEVISRSIMQLGYDIGRQLNRNNLRGSKIISPGSISTAISLVLLGTNGKTYQELMNLLGYDRDSYFSSQPNKIHEEFGSLIKDLIADSPNPSRSDVPWRSTREDYSFRSNPRSEEFGPVNSYHKIHVANGVFVQNGYSLRPDYVATARGIYKSEIQPLDFQRNANGATNYINQWVNQNTFGKIPRLFTEQLPTDTKVIIGNALYFKAPWDLKFLSSGTQIQDFYPDGLNGPPIKINMMVNGGILPFYEGTDCNCKVIGLPYRGNLTTMYIFHPNDSSRQKLKEFQEYLTPARIDELINKMSKKDSFIVLPRMHLKSSINLRTVLTALGQSTLFSSQHSDLSLLTDGSTNQQNFEQNHYSDPLASLQALSNLRNSPNLVRPQLHVDEIIHEVDLVVNEEGTEGGAATAVTFKKTGPKPIRIDTPFMLLLRHDTTKVPIFYGPVYEPTE